MSHHRIAIIFACLLIAAFIPSFSQVSKHGKGAASVQTPFLPWLKLRLQSDELLWMGRHDLLNNEEVIRNLRDSQHPLKKDKDPEEILLDQNSPLLTAWFRYLKFAGDEEAQFQVLRRGGVPFEFQQRDGDVVLLLDGLSVSTVYNTLRTTERTRASKAVSSYILPALKKLPEKFPPTRIVYLAFVVAYGARDLTSSEPASGEAVCLVVRVDQCGKLVSGEISDDEFLENSDVYLANASGFSKLKIKME